MVINSNKRKLYLVVLGGRTKSSHIELHDVRWVIGRNIEDTFHALRNQWFGAIKGLHIDSYMEINFINGYKITLESQRVLSSKVNAKNQNELKLWFINLGGYSNDDLLELHKITLIVAKSKSEAKSKAMRLIDFPVKLRHKDDQSEIDNIDDFHSISELNGFKVKLVLDPLGRDQIIKPDWFGYLRIDK